jgi:hypothetical protein
MPITTNVTSGLPHYRNSKAAVEKYEPLYLNQFEVILSPPAAVAGTEQVKLLVEHVKKVTGLPEITPVGTVEQYYKFAKRTYAAAKPEDTTAELEIEFEVNLNEANAMYTYNTLRRWSNLTFDPDTGGQGVKVQYAGMATIAIHNKQRNIYRIFSFDPVYPMEPFNPMELDYVSDEIYRLTAKFKADAWKEERNGQDDL